MTPSFKQVGYLKCCAASIRDQTGSFRMEHLIQDGGSGSEFEKWAKDQQGAMCVSEPDDGMYDAINRGFRKSVGEIIAWLNCDEQYLPGTLQLVADFFETHPDVDILFGDVVLVDESMKPLAYRRAVRPTIGHIRYSHLSTFSAATFVRRKVLDDGHYLDVRWKTIADAVWIEELLSAGYRGVTFDKPLATFAMLGSNLGQSTALFDERRKWEIELGATDAWQRKAHIWQYRISKLLSGAYLPRRIRVESYESPSQPRKAHTRWLWGFWNHARKQASQQKIDSEGSFSMRRSRKQLSTSHLLFYAGVAILLGHMADTIATGESVKAPLVMMFALMLMSLRATSRDIIIISIIFLVASAYSLRFRPADVAIVRLLTFSIGSVLSYLLAVSFRDVEEWMLITIGLIRRVPQPVILTDSIGKIVLVNAKAEQLLDIGERDLLGLDLSKMIRDEAGIATWQDRPPNSLERIEFNTTGTPVHLPARVFMVGNGKRRLFGFSLGDD
ncbi:MAG: glycosyltransferase [Luteolibacter sp.]